MKMVLAVLAIAATSSFGSPLYLVSCGPGSIPCPVPVHRDPAAGDLVGLNDGAFRRYFQDLAPGPGDFSWSITDSNSRGWIIGQVQGPNSIDTTFLFHGGTVFCCTEDSPIAFNDINENNQVVGAYTFALYGVAPFASPVPVFDWTSVILPRGFDPSLLELPFGPYSTFLGIDKTGQIVGDGFALVNQAPIPEPGTWIAGLPAILLLMQRRSAPRTSSRVSARLNRGIFSRAALRFRP